ncbi:MULTISPECIES: hypothetical protein [Bacillus cereus group]|uniref:hypothetical protein n=1 Tax=Bacillus cereus group TaxID=86661 RepID=UPI000DCF8D0D
MVIKYIAENKHKQECTKSLHIPHSFVRNICLSKKKMPNWHFFIVRVFLSALVFL